MQKDTKKDIKHAKIKEYEIAYEIKSDFEMSINIINTKNLAKYAQKNTKLNNINCKGIEGAFNQQKDFQISFEELEMTDLSQNPVLRINFVFTSTFLMKVSQTLDIPFKMKISEVELFRSKTEHLQKRLNELTKSNQLKYKKSYKQVESQIFKSNNAQNYDEYGGGNDLDYDIKQFLSIQTPQFGKYKIQISMLVKTTTSPYLYFYTSRGYASPFPSGGITTPATNQFIPLNFSYIFDNKSTKQTKHEFFAYDIADYPFEARNFVMTATRIQ